MIDDKTMIKALGLSLLICLTDEDSSQVSGSLTFVNYLLDNEGGLFLLWCNYDVNQISIVSSFYQDLLVW